MRKSIFAVLALLLLASTMLVGCGPKVPDLTGMSQQDAVRAIEDAGFKLGDVSAAVTKDTPLGTIASQSPAPGENARKGTAISVQIASSDGKRVLVPTLGGMEQQTAEGVAKTLGLTPAVVFQYHPTVAKDTVAAQSPDPGAEVTVGSPVVIVMSKGPEPAKGSVPNVVNATEAKAKSALEGAGFTMEAFEIYDDKTPKGAVIAQSPKAGATANIGKKVQVLVSLGKGTGAVKVPAVKGKKEADANAAIQGAGLKVHKVSQYDATVAKGIVIDQFPVSGSTAAAGSEVVILVSLGAEPTTEVAVPDVTTQAAEAAIAALEAAGFSVTQQDVANATAPGTVLYQFPAAGTMLAPGGGVLIVTAIAP